MALTNSEQEMKKMKLKEINREKRYPRIK